MPTVRRAVLAIATVGAVVALLTGCRVLPGKTYTGEGTYYSWTGVGNCSYGPDPGTAYAALNITDYETARMCGAYLRVTGPDGVVTVKVVDSCPECQPGDVDLSPQAFDVIADPVDGRVPISWELVSGGDIGAVAFEVKDGSSQWWLAIQPRNHRNIVTTLEVRAPGGEWQLLTRESYNYFVAPSGVGPGPIEVRITDVHGEQLTAGGISITPGVVQPTTQQFAAH